MAYPSERGARPPSTADLSMRNRSTVAVSIPGGEREDAGRAPYVPLWDQACASLRAVESKHLKILEVNLKDLTSNGSLGDRISQLNDAQQVNIRSGDGVRQTSWQRRLRRTARAILSMKDVTMGLARLDKHGLAPIVLGGVFKVIQVIQNHTDERLAAMTATLEIGYIVSLWNTVENKQILNQDPTLTKLYEKLSDAIVRLYQDIVVLLGKMVAYFGKSKLRQIFAAIAPAHLEWKHIQTEIKSLETNCNNVKSQITLEKENQELNSKILQSISSYDIRSTYQSVLERTGIEGLYSTRCQWLIEHEDFEKWYNSEESSVLWLNGTIGTGKTTLMARAIREMQRSEMVDTDAKPLAIFLFQKALDSVVDVETCLRSLVRQLSWNYTAFKVQPVVEDYYNDFRKQRSDESALTAGECVKLLKDLVSDVETYIMIDAIDECKDPEGLLRKLKELALLLNKDADEDKPLHLMLCSRDDLPITDYFHDCLTITTSPAKSKTDQTFYIEKEMDRMKRLKPGSLFFSSEKGYADRLKKILIEKAGGLFRWTQIQIEKFTKRYRDEDEIEDEFERLESHTTELELNKEYTRLLDSLKSGRNRDRATKMLRLLSCCFVPLITVASFGPLIAVLHLRKTIHALWCRTQAGLSLAKPT